jgi:dihydropyrimidinase
VGSFLIRGGQVVSVDGVKQADLLVRDEQIAAISDVDETLSVPDGCRVYDATGKLVFPGFIEPHAHIYLPLPNGLCTSDDYASATRAATIGGTTTVFDFISPARGESLLSAYDSWRDKAFGQSCCDVAFHLALCEFDARVEAQVRELAGAVRSLKIYLAYPGVGVDDRALFEILALAGELSLLVTAHCENEALVTALSKQLLGAGKVGPRYHADSRPMAVEAAGTHHLLAFAELAGAEVYIVHLSCKRALEQVLAARARGQRVFVETLIQMLLLDQRMTDKNDQEAAKYVVSPPLRPAAEREVLWRAIADGQIDTVATDHAPFFFGEHKGKAERFTEIPNGMPGIEDRINLLYTYGVKRGRISLPRFVELAATAPARIFGLAPQKGTLTVGADADIVVYDPDYRGVVRAANQQMNVDYNPYEGMAIEGRPELVLVRGRAVVENAEPVDARGWGRVLDG